ncbi:FAD-dependent oxidoreductase [Neomegalonema sp.]|uniref:FAD-dependent oxidoreductase n=1 Tax=Neomegalonema sp. TaxID=2039713 RepID=UPI00262BF6D7|nr:FAD-dependent oxidoreductase [Neomegalonema sp.]MDD2867729.1 3-hydroxyacyl-CoA dehydrogenase NAD-binding domain-containing protein [Neomegalonema sp.]
MSQTSPVTLLVEGGTALILIDKPPVNLASRAVREGLMAALDGAEAAAASGQASRVVLAGAGKAFMAGADAKEFAGAPQPPHLPDIVARIAVFPIPVVAAIRGPALGGGLELALAARARVAAPGAVLGLPEVTLGVVPGAGGTQLLPRLIGFAPAVLLISEGRSLGPEEALKLGLIDAVAEDPLAAAREIPIPERAPLALVADAEALAAARTQAARRTPGQIAPLRAIELIEAAARLPLAEGLALERATFLSLKTSDQAGALRHVFFAERAAMSRGKGEAAREIRSAVVVGGGNMGSSIAYALAGLGIDVALVETDAAGAARARENVARLYAEAVKRGKSSEAEAAAEMAARFSFHEGYGALPAADLAIEAAFEDLEVKRAIFAALDAALPETTILATNTSYLDVNAIAEGLRNPGRFLGLHFFSPAHLMKLLEVVKGRETSPETLASALALARRLKKIPVLAGVCDGFIGNRILTRYRQTTDILLLEGATPWAVDAAMRDFGMAMGPYEVQDLSGLDIAYANRKRLGWRTKPGFRYIPIADRIVEETGRLGRKTGAGWYDHGGGAAKPSGFIEAILFEESARAGIRRREIGAAEIVERATTAMIEESLRILEEGIAERPSDVDLVMIHGYAFPRWRGGPMWLADRLGAPEVLRRVEAYAAEDPLSWSPPELLRRLAREGRNLDDLEGGRDA